MHLQGLRIETFVPETAGDEVWQALNPFMDRMHAEAYPEDPQTPLEQRRRNATSVRSDVVRQLWLVRRADSGEVVARANAGFLQNDTNRHVVEFDIEVLPEYRRQGIASELLARIAEFVQQHARTLLMTGTGLPPGEAFLQRLGAKIGMAAHENQLDLNELNRDLIHAWQAQAQERASDFELGLWEGPYPESDLATVAAMRQVMNTAPRDDLDLEDFKWTPEMIREGNELFLKRGGERWTLYAREKATGAIAGYTELFFNPHDPALAFQGDTGVFPQYRNRGLGRWLKAAMLDKLLRERPQVKYVRTGNADSNVAMLKINHELGFKPYKTWGFWQIGLDDTNAYLNQRKQER